MTLAPGTHLGSYEIVAALGAGGMGEVYQARDPKLDRFVAIKVLPEGFAEDRERLKRFQQEARTLSALNHPNVLTIHDLGEHEGVPYLVTELLEGQTLREKLGGKPLSPKRASDLALQVAKGLAAAHEKGILHRDLKPENLFITSDGRVKILDFGLAKLQGPAIGSESETRTNLSEPGRVVGTVGYMSPEQVRGLPLDARSDLFSLGVVLWEMLAGRGPFHRPSALETQHAILKDDPPELDGAMKVPPMLQKIVDTCLAKDPAARFHSAHDLAFGLESLSSMSASGDPAAEAVRLPKRSRRVPARIAAAVLLLAAVAGLATWKPWRAAAPPWDARTVAILPFENRTGDPSLDPLGQRIVDLLRQDLRTVDDLKVAAELQLPSGSGSPAKRLAEATKAHFIAGGSYYLNGADLEFQGRLEDPWTGQVVYQLGPWKAQKAAPDPALAELRQRVGGAVAWTYERGLRYAPGAVRPPRLDALQIYLKAMNEFAGTPMQQLIPRFEQAVALDPDFFPLRLDFFDALAGPTLNRWDKAAEQAVAMETRAGAITPVERVLARLVRSSLEGWRPDMVKATEDLDALMPGIPWVRLRMGQNYLSVLRVGSAVRIFRQIPPDWVAKDAAIALDPNYWLCFALHKQGDFAGELEVARGVRRRFPDLPVPRRFEIRALVGLGRVDEARQTLDELLTLAGGRGGGGNPLLSMLEALEEFRGHGHPEHARRVGEAALRRIQDLPPQAQTSARATLAEVYLGLDRPQDALPIYQQLARESDPLTYHPMRDWGRVGAVLARLGRAEEARAVEAQLSGTARPYLRGAHTYWRACVAANLGEKDRAVELLRQAANQGRALDMYGDNHRNPFLEPLRDYPAYEELIKPKD